MRQFIRFLFSGNDVHKIIAPTIHVDDVLSAGAPSGGMPAPGSMKITFRQNAEGAVQIRPLLPGSIRFIADPSAAGVLPDAAAVEFTSAAYAGWKTLGSLLITVVDKGISGELSQIAPDLAVKPDRIWYGPVRITERFLFDSLRLNLPKAHIGTANRQLIKISNPMWARYAVAEFLAGRYTPKLRLGVDADRDDAVQYAMPTVEIPAGGDIELFVTTALSQNPQDGPDSDFDDPGISRDDPRHRRNGLIPAREVYRQLRADMVEEPDAESLRDAVLADWPDAPRFFPIQFTRTWERIPNCSAHFTLHTGHVEEGGSTLMEQRLPAHGVLFLRQEPAEPEPAPPVVRISLTGGYMKWLPGGGTSWRDRGQTGPVDIDLGAVAQPHIALRLPMTKAIFSDRTRPKPGGSRCTYLSLRRFVRALVDNRIAGGRLNFGVHFTSAGTRGIIQRAFSGIPAVAGFVINNLPDPFSRKDDNDDEAKAEDQNKLRLVLSAFFPAPSPQEVFPAPPARPTVHDQGTMAFHLWQTRLQRFEENDTKRNFSDAHIGRGGPGAAVALNLAQYRVDPVRNPGETDEAYFDRVVGLMLTALQPGAPLQFWHLDSDFEDIKSRSTGGATSDYGHSPIFVDYMRDAAGDITGIRIIDQDGDKDVPVTGPAGNRRLTWDGDGQQIWIAADWEE